MNREPKYRLWVPSFNEMTEPFTVRDLPAYIGALLAHHRDAVFLQCTGLKDKNGVEIYEGDIIELIDSANENVRVVCEYGIARRPAITTGIEIDIPCFYFKKDTGFKSFPIVKNYLGKHDLEILEVIGNIHQNPDLLK